MTKQVPNISIIIPVYNDPDNLLHCLKSVFASQYRDFECIVVDDASTDGTVDVATDFDCRVLRNEVNSGPAYSRNRGAEAARGGILYFVDADVTLAPQTLGNLAAVFENEPGLAAVIGSYDNAPYYQNFISQYKNLFHHFVHQNGNAQASTFWSGCGAMRVEIFRQFKGFDEGFRKPAIEDIELGYRLRAAGHQIRLDHSIQVQHRKKWTLGSLIKTDVFQRGVPWVKLMLRDKFVPNDLNVSHTQKLSVALAWLLVLAALLAVAHFAGWLGLQLPLLAALSTVAILLLMALNADFYRFFIRTRGIFFALRVIPLHFMYFFYCGVSFILGIIGYFFSRNEGHNRDVIFEEN